MDVDQGLKAFLEDCPEPSADAVERLETFLTRHTENGSLSRPLVFITSGGTTVPLEKRCVRFIDNFTTGTRGALSAEAYLDAGYGVIFLTRDRSIQPFSVDLMQHRPVQLLSSFLKNEDGSVLVKNEKEKQLAWLLQKWEDIEKQGTLCVITFQSIFEYMKHLEWISIRLGKLGSKVMIYLAAAVSDFYIPKGDMLEHKIQSSSGELHLQLKGVPKALGALKRHWAKQSFVVSFKLETDEEMLMGKAKGAMKNYGVDAVIANLLHNRTEQVLILKSENECETIHRGEAISIERPLVKCMVALHEAFMQAANHRANHC